MNRIVPLLAIVLTCAVSSAACSGGSGGKASIERCALLSACLVSSAGFGHTCELFESTQNLDRSALGPLEKAFVQQADCMNAASTCAEVQACSVPTAPTPAVCAGTTQAHCSGGSAFQCVSTSGGLTPFQDCTASGLVCAENASGAGCGTASCDATKTAPSCDGDNLVQCDQSGGVLLPLSCRILTYLDCMPGSVAGTFNPACQAAETCGTVNGVAKCVGAGVPCDATTFKNHCEGSSMVMCTGGTTGRLDCSGYDPDATCLDNGSGGLRCEGAGTQCTDQMAESCAGGVITYCLWGTTAKVDCKAQGFSGCALQGGTGGPQGARCTP